MPTTPLLSQAYPRVDNCKFINVNIGTDYESYHQQQRN